MVETMRLARTLACPECCTQVKPFVMGPAGEDGKGRKTVKVRCPRDECGEIFQAYNDEEGDNGISMG